MTTVVEMDRAAGGSPLFVCDFSPPRGSDPALLEPARHLSADFISVGYNPGRFVTVNSVMAATWIRSRFSKEVLVTVATRDMNRLAMQSLLLGADLHGLENIVALRGDRFSPRELSLAKEVNDFTPTGLVSSVKAMNAGQDYRKLDLRAPSGLCVGATIDISGDLENQLSLTKRKVEAGAQFFLLQTVYGAAAASEFLERYADRHSHALNAPVFWGVQMLVEGGISFGAVPEWASADLERGRSSVDIALQVVADLLRAGHRRIYVIPPVPRGDPRDYDSAQALMEACRSLSS